MNYNKAIVAGTLTKDPVVKYLDNNKVVCNFTVVTNKKFKTSSGELKEAAQYHDVTTWGKLAEICGEYMKKGREVLVDGELNTRKYTDKDGVERRVTEILANVIEMTRNGKATKDRQDEPAPAEEFSDEIPF